MSPVNRYAKKNLLFLKKMNKKFNLSTKMINKISGKYRKNWTKCLFLIENDHYYSIMKAEIGK